MATTLIKQNILSPSIFTENLVVHNACAHINKKYAMLFFSKWFKMHCICFVFDTDFVKCLHTLRCLLTF